MRSTEARSLWLLLAGTVLACPACAQWQPASGPSRPMSYEEAVRKVQIRTSAYLGPPATRIRYFTMSDIDLVRAARLETELALDEAYARARPSILNVYVAAVDAGDLTVIQKATAGIGALVDTHPKSRAQAELFSLLHHRRLPVKGAAAFELAKRGISHPPLVPTLKEYLRKGIEAPLILLVARQLLKIEGPKELDLIRGANERAAGHPQMHYRRREFVYLLAEFGDPYSIKETRRVALAKGDSHPRLMALQVLCRSQGVKEVRTAEACLVGPGDLRTVAMNWLFYFGQKSSVAKLRASARDPKQDLRNSEAYLLIPSTMLEFAARIERGERGPRPPDNYYYRGNSAAWSPLGRDGERTAAVTRLRLRSQG